MTAIKVGDEVRILPTRGTLRRREAPADGYRGTVIRAGRKYATAAFDYIADGATLTGEIAFDMESGEQRGLSEFYVRTPEQLDRDERRNVALFHLQNAGVEFSFGRARALTLEQLESLADVVKSWEG